jgi:hypothetical protein
MKAFGARLVMTIVLASCGTAGEDSAASKPSSPPPKPVGKASAPLAKAAPKPDPEEKVDSRVAKAAAVAAELSAKPEDADAILERHGLDRDRLDALMYEIAADEGLAKAYRLARAETQAKAP